jgi:hypothetical protein
MSSWTGRRRVDVDLLRSCVWDAARSDLYILKDQVEAMESALVTDHPQWRAVGVSGLFGAVLVLALGADDAPDSVSTGLRVPADARSAVLAATRSGARALRAAPAPGGRWLVTDADDVPSAQERFRAPGTRHAVVVREPSTLGALAALGPAAPDAVILDLIGSHELGVAGDVAVLVTRDEVLETHWRTLRNHGQPVGRRFHHEHVGVNARVDELNARYVLAEVAQVRARAERLRAVRGALVSRWSDAQAHERADVHGGGGVAVRASSAVAAELDHAGVPVRALEPGWLLVPVPDGPGPAELGLAAARAGGAS